MSKEKLIETLKTSFYFLVVIIITFIFIKYICQRTDVIGTSMSPTLENGDCLIVDKITYKIREPERYEVIVFPYRDGSSRYYVKRIIGLPGETIQIIDGYVYIDGEKIDEPYLTETIKEAGSAVVPITLGEDEYFVMGDKYGERDLSCDHNIEDNKKDIKKITISELSKLIKEEVSQTGEIEEKVDFESPFMVALLESLKKRGITYEEYKKSFQEDD